MTNLEFIDKYIELLKQKIESSKESARLYYANDDYEFGKMEEENRVGYEEELELFKQIKSDLEAWEVVKEVLRLDVETDKNIKEGFSMSPNYWVTMEDWIKRYINVNEEQYEIVKKAMEVK